MKRIIFTMTMIAVLLTGCTTDELIALNDADDATVVSVASSETLGSCVDATALGGSATLSVATGPQVLFQWNSLLSYAPDMTYVSYIELKEDPACPASNGAPQVENMYPIDVFNSASQTITFLSAKCFYWRIVINGYTDSVLKCTTATEWKPATYVQ